MDDKSKIKKVKKEEADDKSKVKKVKKEEDEDEDADAWWLNQKENEDESVKWTSLKHNGVYFPPEYVPHGVKMKYDGNEQSIRLCLFPCSCYRLATDKTISLLTQSFHSFNAWNRQANYTGACCRGDRWILWCPPVHRARREPYLPGELFQGLFKDRQSPQDCKPMLSLWLQQMRRMWFTFCLKYRNAI